MLVIVNLASLLLVVALAWAGVWWLSHRLHGRRRDAGHGRVGDDACATCAGVGATRRLGRIQPCPTCEGTGVRSSA